VNKNIIPFSFGNSIFINQQQHTEEELNEIIRHEFIHVKQQHTIDILLSEIVLLFNWYNPFAWLLRKTIRQNLEFIADQHVLKNGLNKKEYQYLLLKVVGISSFSIGNQFNFSSLKKRIIMMNKMKSARLHLVKFLFIVPLLAVLLLSFRKNIRELILHEIPSEKTMSAKVPVIISNEKSNSANVGKAASDRSVKPGIKLQTSADQTRKLISVIDTLPKVISLKVQPTPEVIIKPIQSDKDLMIDASLKGPLQVIGYRGISRETDPLYVLNGEVLPANFDVNVINPERIESISVLKDKSAINKYGDQAKNGVIEINTKKGYNLEKAVVRKPDLSDFNGICIVDGKEYDSRSFSKLDLDPSDIESVNVYKDQSAIDKYGEKGKNGVIEIRLKNGNTGMPPLSKDTTRPVSGRANIKE
jgi:TonB-dependent SusC/RagA subfamily outer membrane receptor